MDSSRQGPGKCHPPIYSYSKVYFILAAPMRFRSVFCMISPAPRCSLCDPATIHAKLLPSKFCFLDD
ncbi:hypothetical protein OPV22_003743 [Ensete ventricosum]|uniref:Uncharacterized protein n=1 Tax=Ensete ventricosum TaxID=4639 RepID=A0AAV8S1V6_ENSVE|nr:hypothetical protein OPV22_003743 [Ensete ventricosum]